jgi:hypothetical protein
VTVVAAPVDRLLGCVYMCDGVGFIYFDSFDALLAKHCDSPRGSLIILYLTHWGCPDLWLAEGAR